MNRRDVLAGAIFAAAGLGFAILSLGLEQGTALRMGPGRFPFLLSIVLVLVGIGVGLRGLAGQAVAIGAIPWRAVAFILAAPALFGLTVRGVGLVPGVMLVVLTASLASPKASWTYALALGGGLAAACWLIFSVGLGLSLRAIGPWLGG